jgi:hypothetical protein
MRKTLFYAVCAVAFVPYVALLVVGGFWMLLHAGLAKLHAWAHKEGI